MNKKYIDISYANTVANWGLVRTSVDGVIIRIGYRGYSAGNIKKDAKFDMHVAAALSAGVPVGFYFMSQAINEQEAIEEADYCYKQTKAYEFDMPIVYDSEKSNPNGNGRADNLSKERRTAICKAFCDRIQQHGMKAGVYASTSWYKTHLNVSELLDYFIWVAQYNKKCTATHRVDAWQYTSNGTIPGVSGRVDVSECYIDFEKKDNKDQTKNATEKKNLFWVTVADVWTEEEARAAAQRLKGKYPDLAMGIRKGELETIETLD